MRPVLALATVPFLLLAASLVQAQTTAAGVDALIHDDPARAARIFASLTPPAASANPTARFFRAVLSETGFEPQHDPFVPCPLYLSVADSPSPLGAPARAHLQMLGAENPILATCDPLPARASGTVPDATLVPNRTRDRDTHAGVAAFIGGDYQTAAGILTPIAQRNRRSGVDAVALFFTAAMYQSGVGLPFDPVRACALYMRAGPIYSDSRTWFERLNATFARDAVNQLPIEDRRLCTLLGTIGCHRFEPATFFLGAGHSVAFTFSGDGVVAAVSYRGHERPQPIALPMGDGLVFLPLQYTELAARAPARGSRHFVELVMWVPASGTSWQLDWTLLEIVGETVDTIARRTLVESTAGNAPNASVDLRSIVVLRNDEAGRAEWAVLSGPEPSREFLPTKAELNQIRVENQAREPRRAMASSRPLAFPRPPAFDYVDADGCGHLFVFARSTEGGEVLTIRADTEALRLSSNAPRTFDLSAAAGPDLEVEVRVSNHAGHDWRLCSDIQVHEPGDEEESWRAVSGLLTIQVASAGIRVSQPERYRASIQLTGAEFVGPTGNRVRIRRPITLAAWVGVFY